jgi:hypothetical protein
MPHIVGPSLQGTVSRGPTTTTLQFREGWADDRPSKDELQTGHLHVKERFSRGTLICGHRYWSI